MALKYEEISTLETKIEAAKSGDVGEAISLLRGITQFLEHSLPFPEPLRIYLINAFKKITKDDYPPDIGLILPPYPNPKTMAELEEDLQFFEETSDANAAFNLVRPRGRKHTARKTFIRNTVLAMMVSGEIDKGESLEEAIGAVADKMGVSDKTVSRAWYARQDSPLFNKDSK